MECRALLAKGDIKAAIQRAQAAIQQNPAGALPHGVLSEMLLEGLPWTKPDMASKFRQGAKAEALKALEMDALQPNALESLRRLEGRAHGVEALVADPVMQRVDRGEALLRGGHPEQAGSAFEEIAKTAPGVAGIECYAGDAWLAAGKVDMALLAYQRAISDQADCTAALTGLAVVNTRQGRLDGAQNLIIRSIQSDPSDRSAWDAYEAIEKLCGRSLTHLSLPLFAVARFPGKNHVEWMLDLPEDRPDHAFWEEYRIATTVDLGLYYAKIRDVVGTMRASGPFDVSRGAWSDAIRTLPSKDDPAWDPVVPWMRKFARSDHLYAAVFCLFFDSRWRTEYRAWLKSNPDGIRAFLQTYAVRPDFP